jgi:catechol 2,3-dioxygenase-like lactoylglutathione lyase family enzyme
MNETTEHTQAGAVTTTVASTVIRVAELDRSMNFYRDVFGCRIALREPDAALLLARDGFQIYLQATGQARRTRPAPIGVQYLMWATDSLAELKRVATRLRGYDRHTYTYTENGVTFVEGCDPDGGRVIVAYPSPSRLPRGAIASRVRGALRARTGAAAITASARSHRGDGRASEGTPARSAVKVGCGRELSADEIGQDRGLAQVRTLGGRQ